MKLHQAVIKMVNKYNALPENEKVEKFDIMVNWLDSLQWNKVKEVNDIFKDYNKIYYLVFVGKDGFEHGIAVGIINKEKAVDFSWLPINLENNKVKY